METGRAMIRNPLYSEYVGPAYGAITAALNCLEAAIRRDPDANLLDARDGLREAEAAVACWAQFCDEESP